MVWKFEESTFNLCVLQQMGSPAEQEEEGNSSVKESKSALKSRRAEDMNSMLTTRQPHHMTDIAT